MKLTMRGTPYFMAPEVLQQDKFGRRSDVWSIGGVVLQMATTHPPWKPLNFRTPMALFYHVVQTNDPYLSRSPRWSKRDALCSCLQKMRVLKKRAYGSSLAFVVFGALLKGRRWTRTRSRRRSKRSSSAASSETRSNARLSVPDFPSFSLSPDCSISTT